MTTLGRLLVTLMAAAALVAVTVVATRYLSAPKPAPSAVEGAEPSATSSAPAPAEPAAAAATPAAPAVAAVPAGLPAEASAKAGPGEAAAAEGLVILDDRPVEAQKRLSEALRAGIDGPKGKAVREALGALADRLQLAADGAAGDPYSKSYDVASGDTLIGIGQRFLIPYELIMRLNRMSSPSLVAGETIKMIQGPIHVEILKSRYELQAWLGDVCLRVYPVGLGAENKTPEGTFLVKSKLKDPPYQPQHKPASEHRASGAPDNPLGTRWIDIGDHYGIHGTIDPASIGRGVSEGCIRMHNEDVEELYNLLVPGASKVIIRP
ncbi:MAG TPA: L,D-transpeptidase family protein [Phycisphaerae bacterium]|nr:L,D-transpeptidase family protein [Phycisphaerae bacterium]